MSHFWLKMPILVTSVLSHKVCLIRSFRGYGTVTLLLRILTRSSIVEDKIEKQEKKQKEELEDERMKKKKKNIKKNYKNIKKLD